MTRPKVVIIGAGPAGITAAYELAQAGVTDVVLLEATREVGGLARSVNYKGNRIDIGGHRFFSKSDWVMDWWLRILPLAQGERADGVRISYQGASRDLRAPQAAPSSPEHTMLVRDRLSRIYFDGRFFDYPLKANLATARKLGLSRCIAFGASYLKARLFPRRPERSLEDFFINRFGRRLYLQFFKEYTEKVWGLPCERISAQWGAQRVKSLSIGSALLNAARKRLKGGGPARQTSLIERFLYPKYGPGLMWEVAVSRLRERGVEVRFEEEVVGLEHADGLVRALVTRSGARYEGEAFVSTMPLRDLVAGLQPAAPAAPRGIAAGLQYRDFIIVGVLYRRLLPTASARGPLNLVPDNWIYVQEPGVKVGRLQIFNNWSPYLVRDAQTVWVGMEYFCSEGDALWSATEEDLRRLALDEMRRLKLAAPEDHLDSVVIRMPKAYPGYFGDAYARFDELRRYLDGFENLYCVGRNGMHRYNNQDHSMLTAKIAAEAIAAGRSDKQAIWAVNVDDEYHEESSA